MDFDNSISISTLEKMIFCNNSIAVLKGRGLCFWNKESTMQNNRLLWKEHLSWVVTTKLTYNFDQCDLTGIDWLLLCILTYLGDINLSRLLDGGTLLIEL
jgi:hypothetical protein